MENPFNSSLDWCFSSLTLKIQPQSLAPELTINGLCNLNSSLEPPHPHHTPPVRLEFLGPPYTPTHSFPHAPASAIDDCWGGGALSELHKCSFFFFSFLCHCTHGPFPSCDQHMLGIARPALLTSHFHKHHSVCQSRPGPLKNGSVAQCQPPNCVLPVCDEIRRLLRV